MTIFESEFYLKSLPISETIFRFISLYINFSCFEMQNKCSEVVPEYLIDFGEVWFDHKSSIHRHIVAKRQKNKRKKEKVHTCTNLTVYHGIYIYIYEKLVKKIPRFKVKMRKYSRLKL